MITAIGSQVIIILLGFISRRVLIYSVGVEYLGINGLMTNILTIFSLAESGMMIPATVTSSAGEGRIKTLSANGLMFMIVSVMKLMLLVMLQRMVSAVI